MVEVERWTELWAKATANPKNLLTTFTAYSQIIHKMVVVINSSYYFRWGGLFIDGANTVD